MSTQPEVSESTTSSEHCPACGKPVSSGVVRSASGGLLKWQDGEPSFGKDFCASFSGDTISVDPSEPTGDELNSWRSFFNFEKVGAGYYTRGVHCADCRTIVLKY